MPLPCYKALHTQSTSTSRLPSVSHKASWMVLGNMTNYLFCKMVADMPVTKLLSCYSNNGCGYLYKKNTITSFPGLHGFWHSVWQTGGLGVISYVNMGHWVEVLFYFKTSTAHTLTSKDSSWCQRGTVGSSGHFPSKSVWVCGGLACHQNLVCVWMVTWEQE